VPSGVTITGFDPARDVAELVGMWRASFEYGVGVPDPHPIAEQTAYLLDEVVPNHDVRLARDRQGIAGFLAATPQTIAQLYVRVDRLGEGIGSALLRLAQEQSTGDLWLYTFARNTRALGFYARHGFVEVSRGFDPHWRLEDVRLEWRRASSEPAGHSGPSPAAD
jgi:ribosomal protein S18 acetylase RimI-like enzyme